MGAVVSAISLGAVVWWAVHQDRPEFPSSPSAFVPFVGAIGVYATATFVRGWRWHTILDRAGIEHRARDAFGLVVVGYMGNAVLPARGGELLRLLLLKERSSALRREILGSIVAERILDVATLLVLFAGMTWAGLTVFSAASELAGIAVAVAAAAAGALVVYVALRRRGYMERFARLVRPVARSSRLLLGPTGVLLVFATGVLCALESVVLLLVTSTLDLGVTYVECVLLVVLTSFVVALPAAPGYVGTFDAAVILGLGALGVSGSDALAVALLWRFVLFVPITAAGLVLVFWRYGGLPKVRRRVDPDLVAPG